MDDITLIPFVVIILVGISFLSSKLKNKHKRPIVIDKYITWDRHGNPHYWMVMQDKDGNLEQLSVNYKRYYETDTTEISEYS